MINVQAGLKAYGRCLVLPSAQIVAAIYKSDAVRCEKYRNIIGNLNVYTNPLRLPEEEDRDYFMCLDGRHLVSFSLRTRLSSDGLQYYSRSLGEWRPSSYDPIECIAWLLTFEDLQNGEWERLTGTTLRR